MLETIWFILWGVLWAGYFMLDGFDLGVGMMLPYFAKNEKERRIVINTIGPFWDGNEVWLITAGGVTFAAFPSMYAAMFSTMYSPLMIILFALIMRGIAFEFRGKLDSPKWKKIWDISIIVGSFLPAFLFGVAFANIFQGIPFDGEGIFHGTLLTFVNPYGVLGGLLFLSLFSVHGSLWLALKTEGKIHARADKSARVLWPVSVILAVIFLAASHWATDLWSNYLKTPILLVIPLLAVAGLLLTRFFIAKEAWWKSWFASSLTIISATFFGIAGLYPRLFPSSLDPAFSKTINNSASGPLTLKIMLIIVIIFLPVVIAYQVWAYRLFRGKVTEKDLIDGESY